MYFNRAHLSGALAFSFWGLLPIYWKIFAGVTAWDLFGQRLIWSFVTLIGVLTFRKKLRSLSVIWRSRRTRYWLLVSALMISSNWFLYIYAISSGKVLEASMGYYLNPLLNVLLGGILLKERLRPTQWPSIILAVLAISLMTIQAGFQEFPWLALTLSLTFALYGLIRKLVQVGSLEGLAFETCAVIVPVLIYWQYFVPTTPLTVLDGIPAWKVGFLGLAGVMTCTPLVLFAYAAKRLPLRTLGFLQYLSPSFKFLCGLYIFNEALSVEKLQAFFLIWVALVWYTLESYYFIRKSRRPIIAVPE